MQKSMSAEYKFENHSDPQKGITSRGKVKLTDLLSRLNEEKKQERKSTIALSIAAISAVTVFGIILSL